MVLAAVCVVQVGRTALHEITEAEEHVHHSAEAYQALRKAHTGANEDEKTVEALDPGGTLRAANEAGAAAASRGEHGDGNEPSKGAVRKEAAAH